VFKVVGVFVRFSCAASLGEHGIECGEVKYNIQFTMLAQRFCRFRYKTKYFEQKLKVLEYLLPYRRELGRWFIWWNWCWKNSFME
jgi:hypothetical protein